MEYLKLLKPIIHIAIPWNVLEEAPDEREKVRKIGYIGRGAAIFQTCKIIVYLHGNVNQQELKFLVRNLEYLKTPPYLRKHLFKIEPELKFAGLLPPLKTPSHGVNSIVKIGDVREGIVIKWDKYYSIVKIGDNIYAKIPKPYPIGQRIVVKIEAKTGREDTYRAHIVDIEKLGIYWNFEIEVKHIRELLKNSEYDCVILTGKEGNRIDKLFNELLRKIKSSEKILIVFGSPKMGVDDILRREKLEDELNKYYFINFIPFQGVETVRTEEAIIAVLSIIHTMKIIPNIY